jgi:hypothetical protein
MASSTIQSNKLKCSLSIAEAAFLASDKTGDRELVFSTLEGLLLKVCLCKKDIIISE